MKLSSSSSPRRMKTVKPEPKQDVNQDRTLTSRSPASTTTTGITTPSWRSSSSTVTPSTWSIPAIRATEKTPSSAYFLSSWSKQLILHSQPTGKKWVHTLKGPRRSGKTTWIVDQILTVVDFLGYDEWILAVAPSTAQMSSIRSTVRDGLNRGLEPGADRGLFEANIAFSVGSNREIFPRGLNTVYMFVDESHMMSDYLVVDLIHDYPNLREVFMTTL